MAEAQSRLERILQNSPPTAAVILTTFSRLWDSLQSVNAHTAFVLGTTLGLAEALGGAVGDEIRTNMLLAWQHGAHFFDPAWITPQAASDIWKRLITIVVGPQIAAAVEMNLTAEQRAVLIVDAELIRQQWPTFSLQRICAFYEALAYTTPAENEKNMIHALFTCLAHLTKGQNKTASWISSRFKRIQTNMPSVPDLDAAVVQEFSQIHSQTILTAEQIFAVLAASYKVLNDTAASSLCWVIEQAVASNITSALLVADIVTKMQVFPLDMVMDSVVPEPQFLALVRLAMHVYVNRFGTLTGPPVTVKEYADLAYICMAIHKRDTRGKDQSRLMDYAGDYTNFLTKNKTDLDGVAHSIRDLSSAVASRAVAADAILSKYMDNVVGVFEYGGEMKIYVDLGEMPNPNATESHKPPENSVPQGRLPVELRGTYRYYKTTGLEKIADLIKEKETIKSRTFRKCMSVLSICGMQSATTFENLLNTSYRLPYSAVSDEIKSAFSVWLGTEATDFFTAHAARSCNSSENPHAAMNILETYPSFFRYTPPNNAV